MLFENYFWNFCKLEGSNQTSVEEIINVVSFLDEKIKCFTSETLQNVQNVSESKIRKI